MKLIADDVRDVLLELEENLTLNGNINIYQYEKYPIFEKIGRDRYLYTLLQLIDGGILIGNVRQGGNEIVDISIGQITFEGHEFLDNIRPLTTWEKAKNEAKKIGGVSISILAKTAYTTALASIGI